MLVNVSSVTAVVMWCDNRSAIVASRKSPIFLFDLGSKNISIVRSINEIANVSFVTPAVNHAKGYMVASIVDAMRAVF